MIKNVFCLAALAVLTMPANAAEPNDTVKLVIAKGAMIEIQSGNKGVLEFSIDGHFAIIKPGGRVRLDGHYRVDGDAICVVIDPDASGRSQVPSPENCMHLPPNGKTGDSFSVEFGAGKSRLTIN